MLLVKDSKEVFIQERVSREVSVWTTVLGFWSAKGSTVNRTGQLEICTKEHSGISGQDITERKHPGHKGIWLH
jgi:hypothetical protein